MSVAKPCIFLDRDGTIIAERHYLGDPEGVVIETGAIAGLQRLSALGYMLIVLTNQSGIGRGILTPEQVVAVNARTNELLAACGIQIDAWYVCPHAPNQECRCRKPKPGMIDKAEVEHDIDLTRSHVIGDKAADLGLATSRGMHGHLLLTGHGPSYASWASREGFQVHADLEHAAAAIEANHFDAKSMLVT